MVPVKNMVTMFIINNNTLQCYERRETMDSKPGLKKEATSGLLSDSFLVRMILVFFLSMIHSLVPMKSVCDILVEKHPDPSPIYQEAVLDSSHSV